MKDIPRAPPDVLTLLDEPLARTGVHHGPHGGVEGGSGHGDRIPESRLADEIAELPLHEIDEIAILDHLRP